MPQNHPTSSPPTKRISLTRPPRDNWMVSQPQPAPPRRLRSTRAEPAPDVSCVTAHVPILLLRGHLFRPAPTCNHSSFINLLRTGTCKTPSPPGTFSQRALNLPSAATKNVNTSSTLHTTNPTDTPAREVQDAIGAGALNARVSKEAQDMPEKKPQDPAQDPGAASREAGDAALQNAEPKKSQKTRVRIFQRPPCALHALQPMPQC